MRGWGGGGWEREAGEGGSLFEFEWKGDRRELGGGGLLFEAGRVLTFSKNKKSKDYCKADLKPRTLFFITIFRLAIPAFFIFTDVTVNLMKYCYNKKYTLF